LSIVGGNAWEWDETLFGGSAPYYAHGRLPYPPELAAALRDELALDGTGRLLDVGCGPGLVTLLLAPLFERAVGVDADAEMLAEAARRAESGGVENVDWVHLRAEELPAGLGSFRVATFAQSFHWMQRERVAAAVRSMLEPGGAWVHVQVSRGEGDDPLPEPTPPHDEIKELVQAYLGPVRRAGQGTLPDGTASGEEDVMLAAGFDAPRRLDVSGAGVLERSEDDVVAYVYSRSLSAPHLFGERREEFERDLRALLRRFSPQGRFCERARQLELVIWRR
jgi:SAM-dependent methyltransferase